jgi:hypothetical protein
MHNAGAKAHTRAAVARYKNGFQELLPESCCVQCGKDGGGFRGRRVFWGSPADGSNSSLAGVIGMLQASITLI